MIIAVAGPYSATTEAEKKANLDKMNEVAARLLELGHIPIIGVNTALPVIEKAVISDKYKALMDISLTVVGACEGILILAESKGVLMERDLILAKGGKVYYSIHEIPSNQ